MIPSHILQKQKKKTIMSQNMLMSEGEICFTIQGLSNEFRFSWQFHRYVRYFLTRVPVFKLTGSQPQTLFLFHLALN